MMCRWRARWSGFCQRGGCSTEGRFATSQMSSTSHADCGIDYYIGSGHRSQVADRIFPRLRPSRCVSTCCRLRTRHAEMMTASTLTGQGAKRPHAWRGRWACSMHCFCCRRRPVNAHGIQTAEPHPYQGFSSRSTRKPSINLLKPLNRSTTAMSSSTASSSKPNFCTAEVCTASQ